VQKPHGVLHPRVVKVGPQHFGVVCFHCHKVASKWMLADYYGKLLVEPAKIIRRSVAQRHRLGAGRRCPRGWTAARRGTGWGMCVAIMSFDVNQTCRITAESGHQFHPPVLWYSARGFYTVLLPFCTPCLPPIPANSRDILRWVANGGKRGIIDVNNCESWVYAGDAEMFRDQEVAGSNPVAPTS
jgi:hypothetical protein